MSTSTDNCTSDCNTRMSWYWVGLRPTNDSADLEPRPADNPEDTCAPAGRQSIWCATPRPASCRPQCMLRIGCDRGSQLISHSGDATGHQRILDGIVDGTLDGIIESWIFEGMLNGTADGILDGWVEGVLEGTLEGTFDYTMEGTLDALGECWTAL